MSRTCLPHPAGMGKEDFRGAAMPIRVTCPKCRSVFACPDEYRGKTLRCKKCGQPFVVGAPVARKPEAIRPAERRAAPARQLTPRRFAVAALLAVLLGGGIGLPAAWFLLKKHNPSDEVAGGPATGLAPDGPPAILSATGKQESPRDTATKPIPPPVAWTDYTSSEWGFSARFPGAPQVVSLPSLGGKRPQTFEGSVAAVPGRKPVTVSVTCEERDPAETADPVAFLNARAAEVVRDEKTTTPLKMSGFPGVEVRKGEAAGDAWLTTHRFYVVRVRAYHVVASGPTDKDSAALIHQFLDSFTLRDSGEPEPAGPTSPQDRALAWLAANAAAPAEKAIDQAKALLPPAKDGRGFTLALGEAVARSKKPALLAGWGGELFVFELSAEQAKALKLGAADLLANTFAQPAGRRPEKPTLTLSDLKLDVGSPKLAGAVAYRRGEVSVGPIVLRLSYPAGPSLRMRNQPAEAKEASGTLPISGPPLTADDPQLSGPIVVFVEACAADGNQPAAVLSNTVAALVTVSPGPPKGGLAELQLTAPRGWEANYNKFLGGEGGWEIKKAPPTPRSEGEEIRIEPCPKDALTPADYAAHLKEKDWLNVDVAAWVEIGAREDLPDGFVIKGVVKKFPLPKTPPTLGFVAVREIGGMKVRCYSSNLRGPDSLNEALEMFKAANFATPK